jgi:hypothetical protein
MARQRLKLRRTFMPLRNTRRAARYTAARRATHAVMSTPSHAPERCLHHRDDLAQRFSSAQPRSLNERRCCVRVQTVREGYEALPRLRIEREALRSEAGRRAQVRLQGRPGPHAPRLQSSMRHQLPTHATGHADSTPAVGVPASSNQSTQTATAAAQSATGTRSATGRPLPTPPR